MRINIDQFLGERPIVAPHLLPPNNATETLNARIEGGSIVPIKAMTDTTYTVPANTKSFSIYPFDKTKILTRTDNAKFVRSPIANDAWKRVYAAGDVSVPQVFYSSGGTLSSANLGIKKPATISIAPEHQSQVPVDPNTDIIRAAYYVTNVTALGEESEPSDPTVIVNRWDGLSLLLTLGAKNDARAATRRIYRTEGGGEFNFVDEISAATNTYTDSVNSHSLGAPCGSESWNEPPAKLQGLTMVGNGFMVAFFENTLCFSEPYHPHAWPIDYQLSFPDDIISVAITGGAIVIATKGAPWIVLGSHPSATNQISLDIRASGLAKLGHVDMGEVSLYPSPEGLVSAGQNGFGLLTKEVLSRHQWINLEPASFVAFRYREQYLCFNNQKHFIFNLTDGGLYPLDLSSPDDQVLSGHYQADEDTLYLLIKNGSALSVKKFDDGANKQMTWKSREFQTSVGFVMSAARIDADGDATLDILGDNYNFTKLAINDRGFRLPTGRPRKLTLKLTTSSRVNMLTIASSMGELL